MLRAVWNPGLIPAATTTKTHRSYQRIIQSSLAEYTMRKSVTHATKQLKKTAASRHQTEQKHKTQENKDTPHTHTLTSLLPVSWENAALRRWLLMMMRPRTRTRRSDKWRQIIAHVARMDGWLWVCVRSIG